MCTGGGKKFKNYKLITRDTGEGGLECQKTWGGGGGGIRPKVSMGAGSLSDIVFATCSMLSAKSTPMAAMTSQGFDK